MSKLLFDRVNETKFRNLKFGNDSPDYGSSGEPFIQTPLPSIKSNNTDLDGLNIKELLTVKKDDLSRINKFLKTSSGKKFILNQIGLQLSNPQLESKQQNVSSFLGKLGYEDSKIVNKIDNFVDSIGSPSPTRIYNGGINTLAQIGAAGTGFHLKRHGLSPLDNKNLLYENVVKENNTEGKNRLVKLTTQLGIDKYYGIPLEDNKSTVETKIKSITKSKIGKLIDKYIPKIQINKSTSQTERVLFEYPGGPDSLYGIGDTIIKSYYNTNEGFINNENEFKNYTLIKLNNLKIIKNLPVSDLIGENVNVNEINNSNSVYGTLSPGDDVYSVIKQKIEDQKNKEFDAIGSPQYKFNNDLNSPPNYTYTIDKFKSKNIIIKRGDENAEYLGDTSTIFPRIDDDNMVVIFEVFHPFTNISNRISYSAYIKNYRSNTNSNWNSTQYSGRSEEIFAFKGFSRDISFSLQVPCFNPVQLRENHRKTGQLESSLAGFYNSDQVLGSILTKIYLGKYLYGEPGIITSLSYSIPENVDWDVDEMLAHCITMDINFKPIHKNNPQYNLYSNDPWVEGGGFLEDVKNAGLGFTTLKNSQLNKYSKAGLRNNGGLSEGKYIDTIQRKDLRS